MDLKKLEQAARLIIEAVGDDPDREGLRETPKRFADMMAEQFAYTAVSNEDIAREFEKTFATPENDMVVVKDIPIFSHCEHHIALMYNMKAAYPELVAQYSKPSTTTLGLKGRQT